MRSTLQKQTTQSKTTKTSAGASAQNKAKTSNKQVAQQQQVEEVKKAESPKKEFQKNSSQLFFKDDSKRNTPREEGKLQNMIVSKEVTSTVQQQQQQIITSSQVYETEVKVSYQTVEVEERIVTHEEEQVLHEERQEHFVEKQATIVDTKYGDQKIDISDIKENLNDIHQQDNDPSRPRNLGRLDNANEPLPSYSNRVNLGEFSVGNYREFQLREELATLIEKYNKKFDLNAKKPNISSGLTKQDLKDTKYKDKVITNPIAVPDPASGEGNYSWMYLITPYYNQLVKEFNEHQMENNVLKQHYEYFVQMQEEKALLNEEFELLRQSERQLVDKINGVSDENVILEDKVKTQEKNLDQVQPDRIREANEKLENLSNVLQSKDGVIDQLLNEIALIKNEKDDLQNEMLFKKQRIDNLNIDFNTKELEYQRLWEEQQTLKSEMRGENNDSKVVKRENEMLMREIAMVRDELGINQGIYEENQSKAQEQKGLIADYESRLRYANDLIMQLETESQQIQLDLAQSKATIEGNNRAYNELRTNFYMLSNQEAAGQGSMSLSASSPIISIPKVVMPSNYYKPSSTIQKTSINLMPSTSKALSQQAPSVNIKSYLSVKKATIDLTSDISASKKMGGSMRDQKVRFSMDNNTLGGMSKLPAAANSRSVGLDAPSSHQRRGDSVDLRIERRNMKGMLDNELRQSAPQQQQQQANARGGSVNRNFIDTMSGLLGMSEDTQKFINLRASSGQNTFPLKRAENEQVTGTGSMHSPMKQSSFKGSPGVDPYRTAETDVSTDFFDRNPNDSLTMGRQGSTNSNMWTQTPLKNKLVSKGGPGNRSQQPQQINSVKQKQHPYSTRNQGKEEEKYRQATWEERMSQLPKQSAYKSSITFAEDGITVKNVKQQQREQQNLYDGYDSSQQVFSMARDYDVDLDAMNEDDPQAKLQISKYKQAKIFELQDQRKLLQSQLNHIPESSKSVAQRQRKAELEAEVQKLTKRISMMKYDLKKMTSKAIDD